MPDPNDTDNAPPVQITAAVFIADADDAQRADYLQSAVATIGAIEDAVALLLVRQNMPNLGGDERRLITVELADLEAKKAKVRAQMHAFIAGRQSIRPPTVDDLSKVKELAEKLDEMTAEAVMTKAICDAAGEILELYNRAVA